MDNTSTTAYWVAAAIVLVLLVIGVALWYSATTATPGVPNTGTTNTTESMDGTMDASDSTDTNMNTSSSTYDGSSLEYREVQ